jgi:polysaccharide pyruvyl transferase CsaB
MGRTYRIGISGSYGGLNLGDEAILRSMVTRIRASVTAEITVFSRNPQDTAARHDVDRAIPVRDLSRAEIRPEVERLDLLVLGGGGILYDSEARVYLREVQVAREVGVPVMVYAISAGPLKDAAVQSEVREAMEGVEVLTVRDRRSVHVLEEAGVRRQIEVTADPALLLEPRPFPQNALKLKDTKSDRPLVALSVREAGLAAPDLDEQAFTHLLANAADYVIERLNADVVFIPMEARNRDVQQSHMVMAQMARPQRAHILKGDYDAPQILSLVGRFKFVLGMRLHFLIFAAIQRVPFVALPYADKVTGFLEDLGIDAPPVQSVNAGQLIAYVDRTWDNRERLQILLDERVPGLKQRAALTHDILQKVLSGLD